MKIESIIASNKIFWVNPIAFFTSRSRDDDAFNLSVFPQISDVEHLIDRGVESLNLLIRIISNFNLLDMVQIFKD